MDLGTGLTILGSAIGGKDLLIKMLGPTADYIGDGIKLFTEKRLENIQSILKNASLKIGDKINKPGTIHPKVLKFVLDEGSYSDDFLSIEYFGGVLASSRSGNSRDDRGVFFNALITRMSSYQLRFHYVLYHIIKSTFNGCEINWGISKERSKLKVFIPASTFYTFMDFTESEEAKASTILDHIISGLLKEQLIGTDFATGSAELLKIYYSSAEETGLIIEPDRLGFELFYWVYGKGQDDSKDIFKEDLAFHLDKQITIDNKIRKVNI